MSIRQVTVLHNVKNGHNRKEELLFALNNEKESYGDTPGPSLCVGALQIRLSQSVSETIPGSSR